MPTRSLVSMPSVHDNLVYAYVYDCATRRLILHTAFEDRDPHEFTDVAFTDVIAHWFEHVLRQNILFDIEEMPVRRAVNENASLFESSWRYGWPEIEYGGDLALLANELGKQGIRAFQIQSSYGLCGWVLAKNCEYIARERRAEVG